MWTFGLRAPNANYGSVFFMLTGFPVNFIILQVNFNNFSKLLKHYHPDLFSKNTTWQGPFKGNKLSIFFIFSKSELLKNVQPTELRHIYQLTLTSFRLVIFNFLMIIPIAIGLIYWNK
jgi:hypothetical protein